MMTEQEFNERWAGMRECNEDLIAKLQFVLRYFVETKDGTFTFPDGDTWECGQK